MDTKLQMNMIYVIQYLDFGLILNKQKLKFEFDSYNRFIIVLAGCAGI